MTREQTQRSQSASRLWQIAFVLLMGGLTFLFVNLGLWQLDRLAQKEAEIATVEARFGQPSTEFPETGEWAELDPQDLNYRTVAIEGRFDHANTVLVFDNLASSRGQYSGVGYWVMAPYLVGEDGVVWVNRGFVPEHMAQDYVQGGTTAQDRSQIEGVARRPERASPFTPDPDTEERREWVRDPERLSQMLQGGDERITAPVTIDLPAGEPGQLPQGGETEISFSNRHLEYAGTWFAFAAITPVMLGFWLWRQRRPRVLP